MTTKFREANKKEYKFWKSKPVPKLDNKIVESKQIKTCEQIQEKYSNDNETKLPDNYEWLIINITDDELQTVVEFLNIHYRSGTDYVSPFSVDKLRWETMNKGFFVCMKLVNTNNIIGCIGLSEKTLQINSNVETVCEPIYLCCDDKLRATGMSKVLINELIRQGALNNYSVGSFCTNTIIPSPVATIRYYTRPLHYKHLKANNFVNIGDVDDDLAHDRAKIRVVPKNNIVEIAEKTDENIILVSQLYNEYMKSFNLHHVLTLKEIENYFFDDRYVTTMFFKNEKEEIVDFLSYRFYDIINNDRIISTEDKYDNVIKATNIFMYTSNYIRSDILLINAFKVISKEKHHLVYVPDMMGSHDVILSSVKKSDEDTLDEEENAMYDQHMIKSRKKQFINLFNWVTPKMTQDMVSYLIFN